GPPAARRRTHGGWLPARVAAHPRRPGRLPAAHAGSAVRVCRTCRAGPMRLTRVRGWPSACLPLPASAERASFRDTTREQGPGDGFRLPRSVRSAVVSGARLSGSGETLELATRVISGVSV